MQGSPQQVMEERQVQSAMDVRANDGEEPELRESMIQNNALFDASVDGTRTVAVTNMISEGQSIPGTTFQQSRAGLISINEGNTQGVPESRNERLSDVVQ